MSLSDHDVLKLKTSGFTNFEIFELANAKDPEGKDQPSIDLDSPVWVKVIESRQQWWEDKIKRGWAEEEIVNELMAYYDRDKTRTPWDFLKAEYRPVKKVDYLTIVRARKQAAIKAALGNEY